MRVPELWRFRVPALAWVRFEWVWDLGFGFTA